MDEAVVFLISLVLVVGLTAGLAIAVGHEDKETFVKSGYVQQEYCSEVSVKWVKK